jgi:ABC-type polysaccharide/polyol phosphate export permease
VYPSDAIHGTLGVLLRLNPMTVLIEAYSSVILYNTLPDPVSFGAVAIGTLVMVPTMWLLFHRSEFRFAENI